MTREDTDIIVFDAAENNLKHINVRIPLNQITCITGKSGSGKSSLIERVIAKESKRLQKITTGTASEYDKYVRPNFRYIRNLPNAILIKQTQAMRTESSSVATYSGISDGLRDLFLSDGEIVCRCGQHVDNTVDKDQILQVLEQILADETYHFFSLISKNKLIDISLLKSFSSEFAIEKFVVDGKDKIFDIKALSKLSKINKFTIKAFIGSANKSDLASLNLDQFQITSLQVYHAETCHYDFKYNTFCYHCYSLYQSKSISLFTRKQLNRGSGACLSCSGKGNQKAIDFSRLINPKRLITDIDFLNLANNGKAYKYINLQNSYLPRFAKENTIDSSIFFYQMAKQEQEVILRFLEDKLEKYLDHDNLQEFITDKICNICQGSGFNRYALSVFYRNKTIADVLTLTIAEALLFFAETEFQPTLNALNKLALSHIALDRKTNTLSGGELQRLKLVEVITQKSEPLLLIIDEPSIGLHYSDLNNLLSLFRELVAQNNTLLIIDHHPLVIANSDNQIEIGPGSGVRGGNLVVVQESSAETLPLLIKISSSNISAKVTYDSINYHNIISQRVEFPIHQLVCLVGVSGSGKSSLAHYIAENSDEYFDEVIFLSQFTIGRNKRSTVATYLGIAEQLRDLYVSTEQSQLLGLSRGDFSSNSEIGACKVCTGLGGVNGVKCYSCDGQRYNPCILSIVIDEKNISECLKIPIDELSETAPTLFMHEKLNKVLITLIELGLGHLTLGQDIPSVSGGEAQRIKLARYLVDNNNGIVNVDKHNLLILDEPSQGLNNIDSMAVLKILKKLVGYGNSVLVIEHNDIIVAQADFIIEMGPHAGHLGGKVTFAGQAEDYFRQRAKYTVEVKCSVKLENQSQIYPSAAANNKVDTTFFERLEDIYSSYCLVSSEHNVSYFLNKSLMHQHYINYFATSRLFFNPFSSFFINSPLISLDEIEITISRLKKFKLKDVMIDGSLVGISHACELIDNTNCWSILVEAKDFNQAFELGCGWVVILDSNSSLHLSVPMLSLKNKVFAPRNISKNSFNPFYNKCSYCNGLGVVNISDWLILNPMLGILDVGFYQRELAPVIKSKLLRKLKLIVSTFKQQKLFDFSKPFSEYSEQELIIYHQGLPTHNFVKEGGSEAAKRDIIAWPGMVQFLLNNVKYFSEQNTLKFRESLKCKHCAVCGGNKYNQRLNYYLSQTHHEK